MPQIPTAAEVQYMEIHIGDNLRGPLIVAGTICLVAAYIAVAMRFVSRRLIRAEYKADDWFIVAGLVEPRFRMLASSVTDMFDSKVAYTGYDVALGVSTIYGTGRHVILVQNPKALTIVSPTVMAILDPQ